MKCTLFLHDMGKSFKSIIKNFVVMHFVFCYTVNGYSYDFSEITEMFIPIN